MATLRTVTVKASGGDYTSLQAALTAETKDLVTADTQLVIEPYILDPTPVTSFGTWVTDATRTLTIKAAAAARHVGVFDSSKAGLGVTNATALALATCDYLTIDGLQFAITQTTGTTTRRGIATGGALNAGLITLQNCLFMATVTGGTGAMQGMNFADGSPIYRIGNNIFLGAFTDALRLDTISTGYIYHNTFNCPGGTGIRATIATASVRYSNNATVGCTDGYSLTSNHASSTNNASDIAADAPGTNPITGTPTLVNLAGGNVHLAAADAVWKGAGANLFADANFPITTDVDGEARPSAGATDVGADQYVSGVGSTTVAVTGVEYTLEVLDTAPSVATGVDITGVEYTLEQGTSTKSLVALPVVQPPLPPAVARRRAGHRWAVILGHIP